MPFPITCSSCGKTFSIADDVYERKVKGRVVTIKCKQCQAGIRIDDTHGGAPSADAEPLSVVQPEAPPAPAPVASAPEEEPTPVPAPKVEAPKVEAKPEAPKVEAKPEPPKAQPAAAATAPKAQPVAATPKAQPAAAGVPKVQSPMAPRSPTLVGIAAPKAQPSPTAAAPKAQPVAAGALRAQPVAAGAPRAQPTASASRAQPTAAAPQAANAPAAQIATPASPKAEPAKIAASPATPAAAEPAPSTDVLWAVDYPDGQDRELTAAQIKKELAAGAINETTLVWREGMDEWKELSQVPELLAPVPAAAPKPVAPEPVAQRAKAPSAPTLDTAAQRPPAASAPILDTAAQRPRAPSSPGLLEPLGQRPRAPSSPGLPEPLAQRPPAPSAPAIPEPPAQRPPAPPAPAPAPVAKPAATFSPFDTPFDIPKPAADASSPITALTPPSFPAAFPAPISPGATPFAIGAAPQPLSPLPQQPIAAIPQRGGVDEWPRAKSRTPLIIGLILAILVLVGAIFFLTKSSGEAPPPAAPISALPATTPTTAHPNAETTAADDTSSAPNGTSPGDRSNPHAAIEPPPSGPVATPNAGFAELFASGARRADEQRGATGPRQRFDANAAKAALTAAAAGTAACREKGGPAGKATIVVTFEPSGKVSSATVSDAPFAGTSSGACIATAMKRATVPAFSGLPGTVTKTISIQ